MKRRLPYIGVFLVLLIIEVLIALFIKGGFIRYYLGDVIVVWVCYCFAQIFLGGKHNIKTAIGVLIFAFITEFLQGINIVDKLGLGGSAFFRTLIGTKFSLEDLVCYTVGIAVNILGIVIWKKLVTDKKNFFRR
ncbi:MAG: DUF2809 domain-containing protein [Ruminococcus sp.]|nr:DUF2809 domain-containing protein [Ruminococcus sp.]